MKIISRKLITATIALSLVFVFGLAGLSPVSRAATTVSLGAADSFAVLAFSFVTATTPSVVGGDVGLSPAAGTFYTGLTTGQVAGTIYAVDATGPAGAAGNNPTLLTSATGALSSAYTAASQAPAGVGGGIVSADLGGQTLTPGVYQDNGAPASLAITGTLTLDGQGDPNAVFIFRSASTLTTASNSHVTLINGAQSCNVFWQVGSSATLGTGSDFKGTILATASITDNGGSTVEGRFLAMGGAVTLNNTTITKATCAAPGAVPVVSQGSGGVPPLIDLLKTPSPLALPLGGGLVTYTYYVTNIGTVPMRSVNLIDDRCPSQNMKFISSSKNNLLTAVDSNTYLAVNETWTYTCATNLSETTKNIAVVTGLANGVTAADTAVATVAVGLALPPPLIHVVKTPNIFLLPAGGGAVTYSYFVTNPGTAPLEDVSITDNKCTGLPGRVAGHPGDINKNGLLDFGETFYFTCATQIGQTTVNTAIAEGSANGLTAIDFAHATVVVSSPALPNTGLPTKQNTPWSAVLIAGAIMLALSSVAMVLNKRKI